MTGEEMDKEFVVIEKIVAALGPLEPRGRVRVLSYAMDRLGMAELAIWVNQHGKLDNVSR